MEKNNVQMLNEFFEQAMFGAQNPRIDKIGFFNVGYWKGIEHSLEIAQINLIETLVSFFKRRDGNILDVACGKGASSKFLTKYFDPKCITGINISESQLQICKVLAPECTFRMMDATKLEFDDSSFDNMLCIEAAFHFRTRHRFLEEAYRVLKFGGRLAMSDGIVNGPNVLELLPSNQPKEIWPSENCLPDLDAYRSKLSSIGFRHVRIEDITEFSANACHRYLTKVVESEFEKNKDDAALQALTRAAEFNSGVTCCIVYAIK